MHNLEPEEGPVIAGSLQNLRLRLETLAEAVGPTRVIGDLSGECTSIAYDSRRVRPGALFVALAGAHTDGSAYVNDAIKRGAVAVLCHKRTSRSRQVPFIEVETPRRAMALAACALYDHPSHKLCTIGVTGTNGKSSVAYLVRDLLRGAGRCPGLLGTLQYEIGERRIPASRTTPESPDLQAMLYQMVRAGCDSAVMEVSSHGLAQDRVTGTDFDVGIFTNLSVDHLDFHLTLEDYFETKSLLFREGAGVADEHTAMVLNVDDSWGRKLALRAGRRERVLTYGLSPEAEVRAIDERVHAGGIEFELISPWGGASVRLGLLGRFNISNALASIATAGMLGIGLSAVTKALAEVRAVPGRLQAIPHPFRFQVYVDYAHTEDALAHVLRTLREICDGRLILVFGCGGDRDRSKRSRMGATAVRWANRVYLTSDNPRTEDPERILDEIEEGCGAAGSTVVRISDRREAIVEALSFAAAGDVVLVAGKGHETVQEIGNTVVPFDDCQIIRDWLEDKE